MHKTVREATSFIRALIPLVSNPPNKTYLAVPFTDISAAVDLCRNTSIVIGAQNMHDAIEGAFTGEIAGKMLKEAGAQFVILGHSERRRLFGESNDFINRKVKRALQEGLTPLLCIGELEEEREKGRTEKVLAEQLDACLAGIQGTDAAKIFIAYEPVWAIGTGRVATPEQTQDVHAFCRQHLELQFGRNVSEAILILYGGSVNPNNMLALLEQPDVDGFLIGTASLTVDSFSQMVHNQTYKFLKPGR
jgi:triosephosphate isomerase